MLPPLQGMQTLFNLSSGATPQAFQTPGQMPVQLPLGLVPNLSPMLALQQAQLAAAQQSQSTLFSFHKI